MEEHNIYHLPHRSWCRHCIAGRGKDDRHVSGHGESDHRLPTISLDYCFMGERSETSVLDDANIPIVVAKDDKQDQVGGRSGCAGQGCPVRPRGEGRRSRR